MSIDSIASAGLQGMHKGMSTIHQAIEQTARLNESSTPTTDLTETAISLQRGKLQVAVSAKVLATADANLGTLLDIKA